MATNGGPKGYVNSDQHEDGSAWAALNANTHFHMLFLDGAYCKGTHPLLFRRLAAPSADDLQRLTKRIAEPIGRALERKIEEAHARRGPRFADRDCGRLWLRIAVHSLFVLASGRRDLKGWNGSKRVVRIESEGVRYGMNGRGKEVNCVSTAGRRGPIADGEG